MTEEYRQEASTRKESITMLVVSTIVLVIVMVVAPMINKGTPPPKFFIIASIVYGIILAVSIRGITKGGRWLYQITDGRVRVERPNEAEPVIDVALDQILGLHRKVGKKIVVHYLVDQSGEKHRIPEHNKMDVRLRQAIQKRRPEIKKTREIKGEIEEA